LSADVDADVLIVGAGPAGSAAAIVLARAGRRVILVDRSTFPRDKVCGDALIPDAMEAFRTLGVAGEVRRRARKVAALRIYTPDRSYVDVGGELACLPRRLLDDVLLQEARRQGAVFMPGRRFRRLLNGGPRVSGAALADAEGTESALRARYTVLATGAAAGPLAAAGICQRREPSGVALRAYFEMPAAWAADLDRLVISFERSICPGYGWIFPGPADVLNVGVGVFRDTRRPPRITNLRTLWSLFVRNFEPAARVVREGRQLGPVRGAPLRTSLGGADLARPGLFVVGEAAGTTYSFSGEGIGKAVQSGMLAAECILDGPAGRSAPEERYAAQMTARFAARYRAYKKAQDWLSWPWLCNLVARRARRSDYVRARLEGMLAEAEDPAEIFSLRGMVRSLVL
jgi:geranylgeranyl reductase family protein